MDKDKLAKRSAEAVRAAVGYLFDRQRADGAWTDRLSSSPMTTAMGILAFARADPAAHRDRIAAGLAWLERNQRADGGWSMADTFPPSSPGTTAFAVAAFEALAPTTTRDRIDRAQAFIAANGGESVIPGMQGPGPRSWPAAAAIAYVLAGLRDPSQQPYQPFEVMLLPAKLRNKVSIGLPGVLALGIMQARTMKAGPLRRIAQRAAEPKALAWLRSVLGPNGGVEECPMLSAFIYIGLAEAGVAEDIQRASLSYLLETQRDDGSWAVDRDLEIAVTAYAILGLAEVEDVALDSRLEATREWLLSTQWTEPFLPLDMPAGAWSWNVPSGWPESEDTAVVLSALGLLGLRQGHPAIARGLDWLRTRQNRNGSWSEWVRNSNLLNDRPCAGVTAHVLMALHDHGEPFGRRSPGERALRYLERAQRPDGATPSIWFRDDTHGTAKVLEAYAAIGRKRDQVALNARRFLLEQQRPDGAWPVDVVVGAESGTVEETSWAVFALLAAGEDPWSTPVTEAVEWLLDRQDSDGTWPESPVGLYFDDLCYASDLITHTYTLRALGRWCRATSTSVGAV
ncbi:MAG TPA: prenyltransferase/squalene oxidase repeat-containing protein [Streptosporangiaceae bacterium]|nr:prenyltransferase/squalene oxidase repeat-containing protein [Streptosporangiaceae bacterium]